MFINIYYKSKF